MSNPRPCRPLCSLCLAFGGGHLFLVNFSTPLVSKVLLSPGPQPPSLASLSADPARDPILGTHLRVPLPKSLSFPEARLAGWVSPVASLNLFSLMGK